LALLWSGAKGLLLPTWCGVVIVSSWLPEAAALV